MWEASGLIPEKDKTRPIKEIAVKIMVHSVGINTFSEETYMLYTVTDSKPLVVTKDENIDNHGYIGTSILWMYRRNISGYFDTKYRWVKN